MMLVCVGGLVLVRIVMKDGALEQPPVGLSMVPPKLGDSGTCGGVAMVGYRSRCDWLGCVGRRSPGNRGGSRAAHALAGVVDA